jgi:ankyrin repeat protein
MQLLLEHYLIAVPIHSQRKKSFGNTVFHEAASEQSPEVIRALHHVNPSWTMKNNLGRTPLHRAAFYNAIDLPRF